MSDKTKIFRKAALERLSSPEQLDQLMQVTDTKGWIALAGVGALLFAAFAWSVFGEVRTTIQGPGILLLEGGMYELQAQATGEVEAVLVEEGGWVTDSMVVAIIKQPRLEQDTVVAREQLDSLVSQRNRSAELARAQVDHSLAALDQEERQVEAVLDATQDRIEVLTRRAAAEAEAVDRGLLNLAQLERTNEELAGARGDLEGARSRLLQISVSRSAARSRYDSEVNSINQRMATAEQDLEVLRQRLRQAMQIVSPHEGRVTEVMVDQGQLIPSGTPVVSLELGDRGLEALIFVPLEGRKADPLLEDVVSADGAARTDTIRKIAHVLPATINWEEHGYMIGEVVSVSQNPVTRARIMRVLKNESLTQSLIGVGDPYMLQISIQEDSSTFSGFRWTSGEGPDQPITSGVMASARVIVASRRPITLVIPALRGLFGLS